jgi:plastocyanin/predicted small lipoprotein YifL
MRHLTFLAAAAVVVTLAACSESGPIQPPNPTYSTARAESRSGEADVRRIEILDACDPESFNAAVGAGTCTRSGGMSFSQFIDHLTKFGTVDAWRFAPLTIEARVGQRLLAINRGGEVHTFTEVEHFGGGIVPVLNQLTGNLEVAPECRTLAPEDFITPGGTDSDDTVEAPGTEKYQCCIHPWMRTTVNARGS